MKIIGINGSDQGSSGSIAIHTLNYARSKGADVCLACPDPKTKEVATFDVSCSRLDRFLNRVAVHLFGDDGFRNKANTRRLIRFLKKEKPSTVHLFTLHGYFVNIPMLLNYLKKENVNVVWTLSDFWPITGKCTHFLHNNCQKWKTCCFKCPAKSDYPRSYFFDRSHALFLKKKSLYKGFPNLHVVSVSKWEKTIIDQSILSIAKSSAIYNGVDIESVSADSLMNETKTIVLSAAYPWTKYKGLSDVLNVANYFDKLGNNTLSFIIAGIDKPFPVSKNVILLPRQSKDGMVSLYKKASIFFNPSREEVFGLTTIEAQAYGIPVLAMKNSGGTEELIIDGKTGFISNSGDVEDEVNKLLKLMSFNKSDVAKDCIQNAKRFSYYSMCVSYFSLYR